MVKNGDFLCDKYYLLEAQSYMATSNTTITDTTGLTLQQQNAINLAKPLSPVQQALDIPPTVTGPANSNTTVETLNGVTNTVTTTFPANSTSTTVPNVNINAGEPPPPIPDSTFSETVTAPSTPSFGDDWRVRLSLAEGADYLYKEHGIDNTNILFPLKSTNGVIFPYLPAISVSYRANYSPMDIIHTNYKNYFYTNSSVDEVSITADFTAQDNVEAKYMLAVIHFFKSVTKMFYGQDVEPRGGTPPPLCYLSGLGSYQFNNHPLVIASFSYNLPNEVDYVRTETLTGFTAGGIPSALKKGAIKSNIFNDFLTKYRLGGSNLNKGAKPAQPNFTSITSPESKVTYVPTKLQIQITAYPIVTRKDVSENFKLGGKGGYGSGALIKGGFW